MDIELTYAAIRQQREADARHSMLAAGVRRDAAQARRSPASARARWRWFLHLAPSQTPQTSGAPTEASQVTV